MGKVDENDGGERRGGWARTKGEMQEEKEKKDEQTEVKGMVRWRGGGGGGRGARW